MHCVTGTLGCFAGLLLVNALFPPAVSDEAKLCVATLLGATLAFLVRGTEHLVVNLFGVVSGVAVGALAFGVVAEVRPVDPNYYAVALVAGGFVGAAASACTRKGAYVVMYALTGGFLVMSSSSYALWRYGRSARGDLWLTHVTDVSKGVDMGSQSNVICAVAWVAASAAGVVAQNSCCRPEMSDEEAMRLWKKEQREKTYASTDGNKHTV